jgi:hypothetical protein
MRKDVANFFSDRLILPTLRIAVHGSENHCSTCGTVRRLVYSEPVARGYELQSLFCPTCKTALRMVRKKAKGTAPNSRTLTKRLPRKTFARSNVRWPVASSKSHIRIRDGAAPVSLIGGHVPLDAAAQARLCGVSARTVKL